MSARRVHAECTPSALKRYLAEIGHECMTVQEAGWSGKQNAELLRLAEPKFDVLLTLDTNINYQQNLESHEIAIVVLIARSNRLDYLRPLFAECAEVVGKIKKREIIVVGGAE
ncbi:MAG: hypothetical protein AUG75_01170 [Cyanobacteria bacterium 13_1_20CM_4_61_6]|nr:MAG: hypothetical protein AUG75_01170 [Cyanobacteria bacterium 13_1_20CM_4_61_6]